MALKAMPTIAVKSILQLGTVTFADQTKYEMEEKKNNIPCSHTKQKNSYIRDIREGGIL